jgi:hypothetical protein
MLFVASSLIAFVLPGPQAQSLPTDSGIRPITAPIHRIEGTLDLETGAFRRKRNVELGAGGVETVYDNTCGTGFFHGLDPAGASGSSFAEAVGDYAAIPAELFGGDAVCTPGCASSYDISAFEIAWCTLTAPPGGGQIELHFWNTPHQACQLGTTPGNNPFGGTMPPMKEPVFKTVLAGLPRANSVGTLTCYNLVIEVEGTFTLSGSASLVPGDLNGDKFAWSFSMPTSTGADGPILAGNISFGTPCLPCAGTIFEVGGETTDQGTGAGQDVNWFWEDFGGTSVSAGAGDCYFFGGSNPPVGHHLRLFAEDPCATPIGTAFCDATDGALDSCPCGNPGSADTGCNIAQGSGGVRLSVQDQQVSPTNRVTLSGQGFPAMSAPTAIAIRSSTLDTAAPIVFGDGLRCISATVVRLSATFASAGTSTHSFGHGAGGGDYHYQLWFRNIPASFCTPEAFNLSGGRTVSW